MQERKPNRLPKFDYSTPGYYFVTICTEGRVGCLGEISEGKMAANEYGKIVETQWRWLKEHFDYVDLDIFQIMPNHFHGIVILRPSPVGDGLDRPLRKRLPVYNIVGAF